jgi:hypothetical protein
MTAGKNNNELTPPFNKSKPETLKKKTSLP